MSEVDPSSRPEVAFHTGGRSVRHWCYLRPQDWVWGPYETRVCDHCQQMIDEGRAQEVVEEMAARMTVPDGWFMMDPDKWRRGEQRRMAQWLEVRTTCRPAS